MKLNLYVVRHGQTYANAKGVLQGHEDSPLTALGVQCSANTGEALQEVTFKEIFCSDLGRAKDTLQQIGYKSATQYDRRLRERDYGPWTGKPWTEYDTAKKLAVSLPGVESDDHLLERWCDFLSETLTSHVARRSKEYHSTNSSSPQQEENMLVVTHGGMIRTITRHLLQFSPRPLGLNLNKCCINNNSISQFELEIDDNNQSATVPRNCDVVKVFDCKHLVFR